MESNEGGNNKKHFRRRNNERVFHLAEAEPVGGPLQIDMKQEDLSGLLLTGRAVKTGKERSGQCVRRNEDVEAADKLAKGQVIRIALAVEPDGWQQFASAQL